MNLNRCNIFICSQLCSLHECGLLVLWSVLNKSTGDNSLQNRKRIDHQSTWSTVKLTQTKVLDLRPIFGQTLKSMNSRPTSSEFNKTRSYFENELYSDLALQQLHEMNTDKVKLLTSFRCTSLEITNSGILIATNENFFLYARKSFRDNMVRCIQIDGSASARVESTLLLPETNGSIVLVAFTDGRIKAMCCNQHIDHGDESPTNSDLDDGSTSSISSWQPNGTTQQQQLDEDSSLPSTSMRMQSTDPHILVNKSCTIQSLVQNERKMYDELHATNRLDNSEYKVQQNTAANSERHATPYGSLFSNLLNGQMISSNSFGIFKVALDYPLISMLSTGRFMALHKNQLKIFGLLANDIVEIASIGDREKAFISGATTQVNGNMDYLVSLVFVLCYYFEATFSKLNKTEIAFFSCIL